MKVLIIYPDLETTVSYSFGVGIIVSFLKANGHKVKVIQLNEEIDYPLDYERIKKDIESFDPNIVAFSSTSTQFKFVKELAPLIKRDFKVPILLGGIHATSAPEETIGEDAIDFICIGEGEHAFLELVNKLERGEDASNIQNIWLKSNGNVIKNSLREPVQDLDSLPFADREEVDHKRIVSISRGWVNILVGRGCPYRCTYCINHRYFDLYGNKYTVRLRGVDNVLREIEQIAKDPNVKMINFNDDTFTINKEWSLEFCREYAKRFKLPFACNIRPTNFDREIAEALKAAGCQEVKIGLESGSQRVRKEMLNRHMSDDVIIKAFETAKRSGLRCWSFTMIGIPTETREDVLATIKLLAKIRPYIIRCSIMYPFKGTKIHDYCVEHGLIDKEKEEKYANYFDGSILKLDGMSQLDILKFKKMFKWYVDAHSDIEAAPFYKRIVKYFEQLPDEEWENGKAVEMIKIVDRNIDKVFREMKKEHYATRRQIDLNFSAGQNWQLP
jgi:anaerobic magnesium-protoporphyrin IX monomethyl ester cyclase